MLRTHRLTLLLPMLALGAFPRSSAAAVDLPDDFVNEVLVTGLNQPTSMAFLPDGRLLFTEQKTGKVRMVVNGHLAASDPVGVVPNLTTNSYERGVQGIAVDPRWPARPYIYVYYTRTGDRCRLARFKAVGDVGDPLGENLVLGSALLLIDDIADNDPNHQAGCLRFGPDGMLYLSVGEDEDVCAAADSTRLKGAMLRLDVMRLGDASGGPVPRDSITPGDNPLATSHPDARLVWAYGMRNPWRFQFDSETGLAYGADVGENLVEELNEIRPGDYLGWPWREGNVTVSRTVCPEPGGEGAIPYVAPIVAMQRDPDLLVAILSAGVYRPVVGAPSNWPARFNGDVFWAEYYTGSLHRIEKTGATWTAADPEPGQPNSYEWATGMWSCSDFLVGPDGSLWWLRQYDNPQLMGITGSLQRIRYTGHHSGVRDRAATLALASRPNPFSESAELTFRTSAASYVRLEIFDLSGRLVRRLLDATVGPGSQRSRWDGLDRAGSRTPAGVYVARLESSSGIESLRILRLR